MAFEINDHHVEGSQDATMIRILDVPGQGGAYHQYDVVCDTPTQALHVLGQIRFQDGPIKEYGHNGVQGEHLLAIIAHRLRCFQAGPFASAYNAEALEHVNAALGALQRRTADRVARQVEGLNKA